MPHLQSDLHPKPEEEVQAVQVIDIAQKEQLPLRSLPIERKPRAALLVIRYGCSTLVYGNRLNGETEPPKVGDRRAQREGRRPVPFDPSPRHPISLRPV